MNLRSMFLVTVLVLTAVLPAFGQDTGKKENLTIEDLYLTQEIEIALMRSQAVNNDENSKLLALRDIRSMVEAGKAGDSKEIVAILDTLAGEGVIKIVTTNGVVSNDFPMVRKEAIELLGKIGGKQARDTIIKVMKNDKQVMVKAEAVYALGVSAGTDNSDALPYIAEMLRTNTLTKFPDNNLAQACLLAIEKIAEKQGGVTDPDIILAVVDVIYKNVYIDTVERKADIVLKKLRGKK